MRIHASAALLAGLAVLSGGCASAPPPPPSRWVLGDASPQVVAERLRDRSQSFRTVRAVLELVWRPDGEEEPQEGCRASLSWVRPDSLRLRGTSAAFFTVFDLVTDGRRVRLDIPREQVVVFGERGDASWDALPLSARELSIALLADPCETGVCRDSLRWEGRDPPILRGPDWTLELDPATGLPARWQRIDGRGREIRWAEWSVRDGVAWPLRIDLHDVAREEGLEVRMGRVDLDRPIPSDRFSLSIDPEREVLTPYEAKKRWERRGSQLFQP